MTTIVSIIMILLIIIGILVIIEIPRLITRKKQTKKMETRWIYLIRKR